MKSRTLEIILILSVWVALFVFLLVSCNQPTSSKAQPTTEQPTETEVPVPTIKETEAETAIEKPTETKPSVKAEYGYNILWSGRQITQGEFELICKTVYREAGNSSHQTQVMVCLTILNRLHSLDFDNTVYGVIYAERAYAVTKLADFKETVWSEATEKAVIEAFTVNAYPKDLYYFRDDYYHDFGVPYTNIGHIYFSTKN